jgi:Gas vesicle protein G
MLIVDDILLSPFTSILWILREICNAARQEMVNEAEAITAELGYLYMMLETGKITEAEFDEHEQALLDRLDELRGESGE